MAQCTGHAHLPPLELNDVDDRSAAVFEAFMRVLHLHRQLMLRLLAERGSHPGQAFCLRVLAANDGISQRDLAVALHLSRPRVTTMLQGMEKAGVVVRRPDQDDQRLTRVFLTDEGRRMQLDLRSLESELIAQTVGAMSDDDRRELARLLGELADNIALSLRPPKEASHA